MSAISKLTFGYLSAKILGVLRLNWFGTKNPSNERNFLECEESSSRLLFNLHVVWTL